MSKSDYIVNNTLSYAKMKRQHGEHIRPETLEYLLAQWAFDYEMENGQKLVEGAAE